jgi:hypothetical protein
MRTGKTVAPPFEMGFLQTATIITDVLAGGVALFQSIISLFQDLIMDRHTSNADAFVCYVSSMKFAPAVKKTSALITKRFVLMPISTMY